MLAHIPGGRIAGVSVSSCDSSSSRHVKRHVKPRQRSSTLVKSNHALVLVVKVPGTVTATCCSSHRGTVLQHTGTVLHRKRKPQSYTPDVPFSRDPGCRLYGLTTGLLAHHRHCCAGYEAATACRLCDLTAWLSSLQSLLYWLYEARIVGALAGCTGTVGDG